MNMFAHNIKRMIEHYEGELLVINRLNQLCTCRQEGSNEPLPSCDNCFGTGNNTKIRMIRGVVQETDGVSSVKGASGFSIIKQIYIKDIYELNKDDLIIFDNQVFQAFQIKNLRLENNELVYKVCYATPIKYNSALVIENLIKMGVV